MPASEKGTDHTTQEPNIAAKDDRKKENDLDDMPGKKQGGNDNPKEGPTYGEKEQVAIVEEKEKLKPVEPKEPKTSDFKAAATDLIVEEKEKSHPVDRNEPIAADFKAAATDVLRIAQEKAEQEEDRLQQLDEQNENNLYVIPDVGEDMPIHIIDKEVSDIVKVGYGASLDKLMSVVQMIPVSMITKLYKVSIEKFAELLNKRLSANTKYKKRAWVLLQILNKYKAERENEEKSRPDSNSTELPEYLAVPCTKEIKDCFSSEPENSHLLFKVIKTGGDGNCLYRALSNSSHVKDAYPFISGDHEQLRRHMYKLAEASPTVPELIHNSYSNARDRRLTCKQWIKSMSVPKKWGGRAEIIWFAYCMKIHVVCVSVSSARVYVLRTHGLKKLSKVPVTSVKKPNFHVRPKHPKEIIFLWHHDYSKPWKFNGVDDDPENPIDSNHYSLIELQGYSSTSSFPPRTLILPHKDVPIENRQVNLLTPDSKSPNSKRPASPTLLGKQEDDDVVIPRRKKKTKVNDSSTIASLDDTKPPATPAIPRKKEDDHVIPPREKKKTAIVDDSSAVARLDDNKCSASQNILGKKGNELIVTDDKERTIDVNPPPKNSTLDSPETGQKSNCDDVDLVLAIRYVVECNMRETVNIPKQKSELLFLVVENLGLGDCFYESCLNSDVFQSKKPKFGMDVMKLRNALQDFALRNHQLSEDVFLYFHDVRERADMATKLIVMALENDEWDDSRWFFEKLGEDQKFLSSIDSETTMSSTAVREVIQKRHENDELYIDKLLKEYTDSCDIKRLGQDYWMQDIGTMGVYAGNPEMVIFAHLFKLHIVVIREGKKGVTLESTVTYLKDLKNKAQKARSIKATLKNTIFIWAVHEDYLNQPLPDNVATQHYVTLNLTTEDNPIVKLMWENIYTLRQKILEAT